jgi:DUF4097 and DUF4098 domain-containing protein YvlB
MIRLRLTYLISGLALVLGAICPVQAQQRSERPAQADSLYRQMVTQLDYQSQQLADEYLEVLEQLQEVVDDYRLYLEDLDAGRRKEQEVSITVLSEGLKTRKYASNPEELLNDIEGVITNIKRIEADQKAKYNTNNPSSTRVVRNLRKELVTIADLAEDYSDTQVKGVFSGKEMKAYMEESLKAMAKRLAEAGLKTAQSPDEEEEESESPSPPHIIYMPPGSPSVPQPPQKPAQPKAPYVYVVPGSVPPGWDDIETSETGYVRTFEDTINVSARDRIFVSNPTGGLKISGDADGDMVVARLGVEVAAKSREKEKQFIAGTSLKVKRTAGGYEIAAVYPSIADAETRVLRSILAVSIPGSNPVTCSNSFGEVHLGDLTGGVTLTSSYSRIVVADVEGEVSVEGSMGEMSIEGVTGPVKATNSYSPIQISECRGQISAIGSHAPIELTDNDGPATINNSGAVVVQNHRGTVTVDNSYGSVDLEGIEGDIRVTNAYQTISVSDVTGAAEVSNAYSPIDVSSVTGRLLARNTQSNITAKYVGGPIEITCDHGDIYVLLDDEFSGNSTVTATGGSIDLAVDGEPNIIVTARTSRGVISSDLDSDVRTEVSGKATEWKFGTGKYAFKILATDADLTINRKP